MIIYVRTINGQCHTLEVDSGELIETIKERWHDKIGYDIKYMRFIFAGREL
jgi:stalled ribosome rescue protein Dom34